MLTQPRKRAVKNIVLVPYKPKPTEWGSWKIKSPYVTSTVASPSLVPNDQNKDDEMVYVPHSPYILQFTPQNFMRMSKLSVVYRKNIKFMSVLKIIKVKDIN